jgi:hypothetical protein
LDSAELMDPLALNDDALMRCVYFLPPFIPCAS